MWTKRNTFSLSALSESPHEPITRTPSESQSQYTTSDDHDNADTPMHCITSLAYVLIPHVTQDEAACVLAWVLPSPCAAAAAALRQLEYFLAGTEGGCLVAVPLLPPALRPFVAAAAPGLSQWNAGPRRVLHRHERGKAVVAVDTLHAIVASAGSDAHVHVSVFHPLPRAVAVIPHPNPLRCVRLWEGGAFVSRVVDPVQRAEVMAAESSAAYVFTGDACGIVRLWRVDVEAATHFLLTVLVVSASPGCVGFTSPVAILDREDITRVAATVKREKMIHCLVVDRDSRLIAGTDGGLVVWQVDALPWKPREDTHTLCWDQNTHMTDPFLTARLRIRADRMVNQCVWVKSDALLREFLSRSSTAAAAAAGFPCSRWRPKYSARVAGGFDIGVVTNVPILPAPQGPLEDNCAATFLLSAAAPVAFPALRNGVTFPLAAMEPVAFPRSVLAAHGAVSCTAVVVLQPGVRIATSGSDGSVAIWQWDLSAETYAQTLFTGEGMGHCGIGRHMLRLRAPDIFLSCGQEDGIVKEWHVYDEPELLMRCERRFTLRSANNSEAIAGVSCAAVFPAFHAVFLVGTHESAIQVVSLSEVQGCAPPADYIYNGFKTVRVPSPLEEAPLA